MKISTKGRYGLRIMMDLAQHNSDTPRMIADICKSQNLTRKYVGRLIISLRKAGLVYSIRGAMGGYKIKKAPEEITILEIIETMEGALSIVSCVECPLKCKQSSNCAARKLWKELNSKIKNEFQSITLRDVLNSESKINGNCI